MRHNSQLATLFGLLVLGLASGRAAAQVDFTTADWLLHRGNAARTGGNQDPGIAPTGLLQTWIYPSTSAMPAEMVIDNTTLPVPPPNGTLQNFTVKGAWVYPSVDLRQGGAWPPISTEANPDKTGDYIWAEPQNSPVLSTIGTTTLARLPNLGTDAASSQTYKIINNELNETLPANNAMGYSRWAFGTTYPTGTLQGNKDVGGNNLAANQRYAVYIRFPSSGTISNGVNRPNTQHVFARVSWGATLTDPKTSRIFMLDFQQTGGFWLRIRNGAGDDRYFPFDGTNPLTVTLYTKTPDDEAAAGEQRSIIVADSVRLVPEAMRGDIHAPAASAKFPATVAPGGRVIQRTYFGRDETVGPGWVKVLADAGKFPLGGFTQTLFDPTVDPQPDSAKANYNPIIPEVSGSVRTAVFYCIEDNIAAHTFGKLKWRYATNPTPPPTATVDDTSGLPGFDAQPGLDPTGWTPQINPAYQSYGPSFLTAKANKSNFAAKATWQAPLSATTVGGTFSVYAWIPALTKNTAIQPANYAQYKVYTDIGPVTYTVNQESDVDPTNNMVNGAAAVGGWRRIASNVHFPAGVYNGSNVAVLGKVSVSPNPVFSTDDSIARSVIADALQFVPESPASNTVTASPLLANVNFPSGALRQLVYFATTDGHVYALDAEGAANNSTLTSAYWVYPSISDPNPMRVDKNGDGLFGPEDDPNVNPDAFSNRPAQGIDADIVKTTAPDPGNPGMFKDVYTKANEMPALQAWKSSPMFVQVRTGVNPMFTYQPLIVIGNQNGRIYAFDPIGRVDPLTNDPYASTFAVADVPGVAGTTRRVMTWPTTARDKWLRKGGTITGPMSQYTDDAAKGYFNASLSANVDPADFTFTADRIVGGAGDGHVYCIDLQKLKVNERISNPDNITPANDGKPRWQYPNTRNALDPISYPGAYSIASGNRYSFTSGGRLYAVDDPGTQVNGTATLQFVYPGTSRPPGNPLLADKPPLETEFTGPIMMTGTPLNAGKLVVLITNKDGSTYAFDATVSGGIEPPLIWHNQAISATRASATYIRSLHPQLGYSAADGPAVLIPSDNGSISGYNVATGNFMWTFYDGFLGQVPLVTNDSSGVQTSLPFSTSNTWRGADATVANGFIFQGDEGIQDTGEMNGQMRAYGSSIFGHGTGGEQFVNPDARTVELRMVDFFNAQADDPANNMDPTLVWEKFRIFGMGAKSPYDVRIAGRQKANTQNGLVVYEWGDTIFVAAWGLVKEGLMPGPLPEVVFTKSGGGRVISQTVGAVRDLSYSGPDAGALKMKDPVTGLATITATAWRASARFDLDTGNEQDPQTPGTQVIISAYALVQANGAGAPSFQLTAGQIDPYVASAMGGSFPKDPSQDGAPRQVITAHPFALTSRGTGVAAGAGNTVGWTDGYPISNATTPVDEIAANGNYTVTATGAGIVPNILKDLAAPLGMITHGGSALYKGVDGVGNSVPSLFLADRSNLYKRGIHLNKVKVARSDAKWGWDVTNAAQFATGNVMNALPWETFPNMIPNVSPDYSNVDRTHTNFSLSGIDMSSRPVRMEWPLINGGNKTLVPTSVDLQVEVPKYQSANVGADYFDLNGVLHQGFANGLMAPMSNSTGGTVPFGLRGLLSPSAGYVGTYLVYIASAADGLYHGQQARDFLQAATNIPGGREDVFRQLHVSFTVQPDMNIRTDEETVDVGKEPHGFGFYPGNTNPFVPSYTGGVDGNPLLSPWDQSNIQTFFRPFTVRNDGNVNLVDMRVAKIVGDYGTNYKNPLFWLQMRSDQVDPVTNLPIYGLKYNFLGGTSAGNLGIVTSLDRANQGGVKWENYFWPYVLPNPIAAGDYVQSGNVLGWNTGERLRSTIHKPRVGGSAQVMSIPDVAYGDPLNVIGQLQALDTANGRAARDVRPKIGVTVPMGTPVGTYSAPIIPYEDHTPEQWRDWVQYYRQYVTNGMASGTGPPIGDDDGILDIATLNAAPAVALALMQEGKADPGFRLKVTVTENRLTNGTIPGSLDLIDKRGVLPAFGSNIQPTAIRDPNTGRMILYWTSNRPNNLGPAPITPDAPWYLQFSSMNPAIGNDATYGKIFDWSYATTLDRWWQPLAAASQYPDSGINNQLFPGQASDLVGVPATTTLVPGVVIPESVRHFTPGLAQDDDPAKNNAPIWLFWQGSSFKSSGGAGQSQRSDTRTFYTQLDSGGLPVNSTPYSFLNDPSLPKFGLKPFVMTDLNNKTDYFLFWYGGEQGRTKLYYNVNNGDPTKPDQWTNDVLMPTPANLQTQSHPDAMHRRVITSAITGNPQAVDAIDVAYTGEFGSRRQSETLITRYAVLTNGAGKVRLQVIPLTPVDNETMVRDGIQNTWVSRDVTWVYRDGITRSFMFTDVDGISKPFFQVFVYDKNGVSKATYAGGAPAPINGFNQGAQTFTPPTFDNATGKLYFNTSFGGQIIADPQGGTVSFGGVAPSATDRVAILYTPQTMRANVTRNETGVITPPVGWETDPGYAPRPHVSASGANTSPVTFIDRANNARPENILPAIAPGGAIPPVTRMWLFYRKTNVSTTGTGTIYYKTMRLMVRLPRGVLRDVDMSGNFTFAPNITITGASGPVEVDWVRGRLYFTEADEGRTINVTFNYGRDAMGNKQAVPAANYRIGWGDEFSAAVKPGDQTSNEIAVPMDSPVNEGMISAFKDPFQDKVWLFWSSTRAGTTDLYYMALSPQFYPLPAQ